MAEKIFFLYLTGFQNFQGTVCGGFGVFFQYHCPDSGQNMGRYPSRYTQSS